MKNKVFDTINQSITLNKFYLNKTAIYISAKTYFYINTALSVQKIYLVWRFSDCHTSPKQLYINFTYISKILIL